MNTFSVIPRVVEELANSVEKLHVRTEISLSASRMGAGPPDDYVEREHAFKIGAELRQYLDHKWTTPDTDRAFMHNVGRICTSSIQRPLTRTELVSLLSRAYQAGRDGR